MSYNADPPPKYEGNPPQAGYPAGEGQPPAPVYPQHAYAPQPGYPPQPGHYPPPTAGYAQGVHSTVIVQQGMGPLSGSTMRYNQSPALIVCQHCQATVTTSMDYKTGLLTWLIAGGACLMGCWLGCCLIPFCLDATKDVEHKCPNCKNVVGMFRHIR
ncbi:hypothetical protein PoB_007023500 [Plakobranchus ocellatus]|uniref:LITAF domain-containing protein n=1 Tax=Plakobranchus ocellatus TaxID=259542 RepID=A0AAV4DIA9_9GAST|nr:hypothetical protein PoB_007023500 [Plakobranchus ocellatus]